MYTNKHNMDIGRERGRGEREAFASLRLEALSAEEKTTMRRDLLYAIQQEKTVMPTRRQTVSLFSLLFGRTFAVSALIIILVAGSGLSVARASDQALPGDILYPVKTQFSEPLIASFKNSDTARAEWEHKLIERRIREAETLAERGRLGDDEKNELEQQLSEHRGTLERLEGHEISDDEFIPARPASEVKKIEIFLENRENESRIRIEERETKNNDGKEMESQDGGDFVQHEGDDTLQGKVEGVWQENESSSDSRTNEVKSKKNEGSSTRVKEEGGKSTNEDVKIKEEIEKKDSSSEESEPSKEESDSEKSESSGSNSGSSHV